MPPIATPNPKQALVLFALLFTGDEPMATKLKPRLSAKERKPLEKAGLIVLERRGRATHVVLTDAAWDWAGKNLDVPISAQARANETLAAVFVHLKAFLDGRGIQLAEIARAGVGRANKASVPGKLDSKTRANHPTEVVARVREICLRAAGGRSAVRVRLAQVREALPDVTRAELDRTLLAMHRSGAAVFFPLDNPQDRYPADESGALRIAGTPHHVLYLDG